MSEAGDAAKVDNFQTQASAIVYRLVDPGRGIDLEQGAIDALQQLYDAYPPHVQQVIRSEVLPRITNFNLATGWSACPDCVRGLRSPDQVVYDAKGRETAFEKVTCATCRGSGELEQSGAPVAVPKMTRAEIEKKYGVVIED